MRRSVIWLAAMGMLVLAPVGAAIRADNRFDGQYRVFLVVSSTNDPQAIPQGSRVTALGFGFTVIGGMLSSGASGQIGAGGQLSGGTIDLPDGAGQLGGQGQCGFNGTFSPPTGGKAVSVDGFGDCTLSLYQGVRFSVSIHGQRLGGTPPPSTPPSGGGGTTDLTPVTLDGTVDLVRDGQDRGAATKQVGVREGDELGSGAKPVRLTFADGTTVVMDSKSTLAIGSSDPSTPKAAPELKLARGAIWYWAHNGVPDVVTSHTNVGGWCAGPRTATFTVATGSAWTRVQNYAGCEVQFTAPPSSSHTVFVDKGMESTVRGAGTPSRPRPFTPPARRFWSELAPRH